MGASRAGFFGALLATLGVVLPAFLIILLIAAFLKNLLRYRPVQAVLEGIRPVVVGLILATGASMLLSLFFSVATLPAVWHIDPFAILLFALLVLFSYLGRRLFRKSPSPILIILLSAGLGMLFYGLF